MTPGCFARLVDAALEIDALALDRGQLSIEVVKHSATQLPVLHYAGWSFI